MATVRKRIVGKDRKSVRWDAVWEVGGKQGDRQRRIKTFLTQKEAKDFLSRIGGSVPTLSANFEALKNHFLSNYEKLVATGTREASTLKQLREHFKIHIMADTELAASKCANITTETVQGFLDRLTPKVTPAMAKKVRATLSQVFSYGARRGFVTFNPVRDTKLEVTARPEIEDSIEPFTLPPKADLVKLLTTAKQYDNTGKAEAVVSLFMYCGLLASELRGLPWTNCALDGDNKKVSVHQKADLAGKIGKVKSRAGKRDVGIGPDTAEMLKRWGEASPDGSFVLSNEAGNPISHGNLWNRFWVPLMNKAGLVADEPASKVVREASEEQQNFKKPAFGFHMLRHVYASLQIEQGVSPKMLQKLMGHSTLKLTMDTYGHLWPDDAADQARANAVEKALQAG